MKFYIISDTHGKIDKALRIYSKLHSVDFIIHLGDLERDARAIEDLTGKTVISVLGNNEGLYKKEDFRILETECGNLLITHGHKQKVKSGLLNLLYMAGELHCKAAIFGHTHVPVFTESDGVYLLNPGSLTLPMDGSEGSYAILNTTGGEFSASVVYYNSIFETKGFL